MCLSIQGIPQPVVFEIYEEALSVCENTVLTLTLPLKDFQHKKAAALPDNRLPLQTPPPPCLPPYLPNTCSQHIVRQSGHHTAPGGCKLNSSLTSNQRRERVVMYSRHFSPACIVSNSEQVSQEREEIKLRAVTSLSSTSGMGSERAWIAAAR